MTTQEQHAVALETARQIGGKAFFMMGTKKKVSDGTALGFNVCGAAQRINWIWIRLNDSDTYTVEFWCNPVSARAMMNGKKHRLVESREGIYNDALHEVIERVTGLRLAL